MQLLVHMHLESDAVFGNGMSMPGGEDICVLTDPEGFPYLKGSTLKGIFREELINYMAWERKPDTEALEMVKELLGESGSDDLACQRRVVFSDLTLHPELIRRIREEENITGQEIQAMFTYLRVFTGLEDGVARKESLRTARCIKKGLHFYGLCTCSEQDVKLVQEVLKMIKWAGSMRSRGFGKVRIRGGSINMKYLELEFQNVEPLRIADDDTSQHGQVNTLSYIPGSTIRGAAIHALCEDKEFFDRAKKALFSERIHFMNAYLQRDGKKMIPSLKGFYEDKTVCEGKKKIENVLLGDVTPGTKRASLGRYCYPEGDCIFYGDVELGEDMNINLGREEKKNVFRSQYIQKNQQFASCITFDDTVDEEIIDRIREVFSGILRIGNSRYSGYGACRVKSAEIKEGIPYGEFRQQKDRSQFCMALLSNMTMRSQYGETVGLDLEVLAEELGCGALQLVRCATSTVEVFGYNRSWKGPVPSEAMYEAGSVFILKTAGGDVIPSERFCRLEERGLGVRRNEGFGQVLFYDDYAALSYKQPMEKAASLKEAGKITPEGCRMEEEDLKTAAKGLLVYRLERAMEQYLVEHPLMLGGISNSKLGVIQSLCLELRYVPKEAKVRLMDYIRHSEEKDQRKSSHDGKKKQDALHQYVVSMLEDDLMGRLHIEGEKILGLNVSELLTEEEQLRYKLQLMIDQIRYANREAKKYAD